MSRSANRHSSVASERTADRIGEVRCVSAVPGIPTFRMFVVDGSLLSFQVMYRERESERASERASERSGGRKNGKIPAKTEVILLP